MVSKDSPRRRLKRLQAELERDPNQPDIFCQIAEMMWESGRADLALNQLEKASRLTGGESPEIEMRLGEAFAAIHDPFRALESARRALKFLKEDSAELSRRFEHLERACLEGWVRAKLTALRARLALKEVAWISEQFEQKVEELEEKLPSAPSYEELKAVEAELRLRGI